MAGSRRGLLATTTRHLLAGRMAPAGRRVMTLNADWHEPVSDQHTHRPSPPPRMGSAGRPDGTRLLDVWGSPTGRAVAQPLRQTSKSPKLLENNSRLEPVQSSAAHVPYVAIWRRSARGTPSPAGCPIRDLTIGTRPAPARAASFIGWALRVRVNRPNAPSCDGARASDDDVAR